MENSTQTATAIVPFINYNQTLESDIQIVIKTEKKIKSAQRRLFIGDTDHVWDKTERKWVFGQNGQAFKIGKVWRSAEKLERKDLLKTLRENFQSQRLSEAKAFHDLVVDGSLEDWFNHRPKDKRSKPMTNVGSLLKAFKSETKEVSETAEAETPDVGTSEAQSEPQEQVVSVPQSEEDFVALMIERGLDLNKVVEIIFDLDKSEKVA
tara:strand:+ start:262 stop:885 length:624 start_codon:yes stop_codon:yes gene_type:complete